MWLNPSFNELWGWNYGPSKVFAYKYGICTPSLLEQSIQTIDSSPDIDARGHATVQYMDEIRKLRDVHPSEYTRLNRILNKHSTAAYKKYEQS